MKNINWKTPNSKRGQNKVLNIEPNQNNNLVKGLDLHQKTYF